MLLPGTLILPVAVPLAMFLPTMPFCSWQFLKTGSGLSTDRGGSGLLTGSSGLLKRSGTLTGDLTIGGEGLLTRPTDSTGVADMGLFARNNPLPASRAGTDLAWLLDSPLLSGYS